MISNTYTPSPTPAENSSKGSKSSKEKSYAWQNSWGLTTRSIGVMVMVHGDDKGLVNPPRVSPVQVVVVWIVKSKMTDDQVAAVKDTCYKIGQTLKGAGVRVEVDDRLDKSSGWKYNYWELRGAVKMYNMILAMRATFGEQYL